MLDRREFLKNTLWVGAAISTPSYLISSTFAAPVDNQQAPAPYGVLPTSHQIEWQKLEYYMFIHFGPNTFTDVEWGNGKEDPKVFNPTNVDCNQWAKTAVDAGMKAIILTAKHHDGFCLWPSQFSTHTVRESPWKNGQGDLLRELSDACKKHNLKFGVYLSPWDQNHPAYGTPEYNQVFANTLTEVLTNYGDIFEQWFDGAMGESGAAKKQPYDWQLFNSTVYKHQPQAIIFSDVGPGCRWIGNEQGIAGLTNWSRLNTQGFTPGIGAPTPDVLNQGNIDGKNWVPGEADVSIRPGWFYSSSTDNKVKTLQQLLDIYHSSIGRNANLLLNVPPDRRGLIHANDVNRLMELKQVLDQTYAVNLSENASITSSHLRGNHAKFSANNILNANYDQYWSVDETQLTAELEITLKKQELFNRIVLQEYIPLGQRIKQFKVEYWDNNQWRILDQQTTMGYKRILHFPRISTNKLKVTIQDSLACPVINFIGVYNAPELLSNPIISRDKNGVVTIKNESIDAVIYYTVNGAIPVIGNSDTTKYTDSFVFANAGTITAVAYINQNSQHSEPVVAEYDISPKLWKVADYSTELTSKGVAKYAIDSESYTAWSTLSLDTILPNNSPHFISIDLGEELLLKGFYYLPVENNFSFYIGHSEPRLKADFHITEYNFYGSNDGKKWTPIIQKSNFANIKNNPILQNVIFDKPIKARYIKLEVLSSTAERQLGQSYPDISVAEIGVITR